MLTEIVLDDFKAFGSRQHIPLSPITLIFGANSAGKSSILQSILLLRQTLRNPEGSDALLMPKGDLTDLGSFRELIFRHDARKTVEIKISFTEDRSRRRTSFALPSLRVERMKEVGLGFHFKYDRADKLVKLKSTDFYFEDRDKPAFYLSSSEEPKRAERAFRRNGIFARQPRPITYATFQELRSIRSSHPIWKRLYEEGEPAREHYLKRLRGLVEDEVGRPELNYVARSLVYAVAQEDPEAKEAELRKKAIEVVRTQIDRLARYSFPKFLEDVKTYNANRSIAVRQFLPDDTARVASEPDDALMLRRLSESIGGHGEQYPDIIRAAISSGDDLRATLDSVVYLGPLREYPERHYIYSGNVAKDVGKSGRMLPDMLFKNASLVNETNEILRNFDIGFQLQVDKARDPKVEDVFALRLIDQKSKTSVSMLDVGFGISQVLPVIVQSMLAEDNIILIEQPEIHLHPRLQADLGSVLERAIREPRNNQFIIETHSEHLILRLQRLIREKVLNSTDVSVLYVTKGDQGSICHSIRLDESGEFIDAWPEGFFEEGYREIFANL